jgi:hypothetical protein
MRFTDQIRRLVCDEDGRLMGNLIFFGIIIAIIGIAVIDGTSVFSAYQIADETTTDAARQAKYEYETAKDDVKAENAAADTCEASGLKFEVFEIRYDYGHTYKIVCSKEAETYVFKYIPFLKDLTHQEKLVITSEI